MDNVQFQLISPIPGKDGDEVNIIEMRPFTILRSENSVTRSILALEQIITGAYTRMGEDSTQEEKEEIKEAVEEARQKKEAAEEAANYDPLTEKKESEADKGQLLKLVLCRYAADENTLGRVISLMDEITKKRRKHMLFVDDRPMTDLEYDTLSFRDHENLMLSYLANFILTS